MGPDGSRSDPQPLAEPHTKARPHTLTLIACSVALITCSVTVTKPPIRPRSPGDTSGGSDAGDASGGGKQPRSGGSSHTAKGAPP